MAITCSGPTAHYANGCELLLAYDKDNDGIISKYDAEVAVNDSNAGVITGDEGSFVVMCYLHGGDINVLCLGCYTLPLTAVTFVTKKEDGSELTGVKVFIDGIENGVT